MLMKKFFLLLAAALIGLTASAQTVVIVEDISTYTGTEQYVFNQKDGKTYARNNLGTYERYGTYEHVNTLTVKSASGVQQVEYIKNDNEAYIDLGYKPTRDTRIEAVFTATEGPDWKALYGTRFEANTQNDVEFPGTSNYSAGNGWKHGFAFFTTNGAVNLGGETVERDKMIFGQKIKTIQDATTGTLEIYQGDELANTITDTPLTADCETSLYILAINKHLPIIAGYNDNPDAFGGNSDPCINQWVTLYSMKIYEGSTLKYDLVPVLSEGKGGLLDKVNNKVYYSANNADFVVPEESGITVYDGKIVIYNNRVYKYADGSFSDQGELTKTAIAETAYRNLNNWTTTDDHVDVFSGKIDYVEADGTNHIEHYTGTGGYEPLWTTIATEEDQVYNFSFDFSCSAWNSWNADEKMKAFVFSDPDFGITNNGYDTDRGQTLGRFQLPTDETEDLNVSIDFTATTATSTLIYQFGYVDDGQDFRFYFDHLNVSKYDLPAYPSLNPYGPQLALLIPEVEAAELNTTVAIKNSLDEALTQAKAVADAGNLVAQKEALENLQKYFALAKAIDVTILQKTIDVAKEEGVSTTAAEDYIQNGTEETVLNKTLSAMRTSRKVVHIDTDNASYTGHEPAEGKVYLYNVGRKAYLTNGSDWGAHAALGFPGLEATLAANDAGYTIQFEELIPGDARDRFLGGSPYVDCADDAKGTYTFEAVSGKTGVYNIKGDRGYLAFDPEGEVDGGGILHFNTVTAMWATPKNEDAEWILVSKEDRVAQLDNATDENPVDASYVIKNASFNKYANNGSPWTGINQGWEWGNRDFGDKNTEHFHSTSEDSPFSLSQEISLPKEGWYELTVQAYFRDGNINPHVESVQNEETLADAPVMYFNSEESPLMYIHAEADKAPGEGTDTKIGNFPNNMMEAAKFFENGLYKNSLLFHVDAADLSSAVIGIDELEATNLNLIFKLYRYG